MTERTYSVELPFEIPGYKVHFGLPMLKESGVFDELPLDIRAKLEQSSVNWEPVTITKAMLDELDDKTWHHLSELIGNNV